MMALVSGGCTIDALTWAGDQQAAVDLTLQVIEFLERAWNDYFLGGIWLSALGLAALADRAEQTRLVGGDPSRGPRARRGTCSSGRSRPRDAAGPRGGRLGPEGRAWMAAGPGRATAGCSATTTPTLWRRPRRPSSTTATGTRWPAAGGGWPTALAGGAATRPAARVGSRRSTGGGAPSMGARPLADAVQDLGRRARLDLPGIRAARRRADRARGGGAARWSPRA